MSTNTIVVDKSNFLQNNVDTSKIFLGKNESFQAVFTAGVTDVLLEAGTLMGRIGATQKVVPLKSTAVDGSQFPVGILNSTRDVLANATVSVAIVNKGDVAREQVIFDGTDTFTTLVSARSLEDRIASDTAGIILVKTSELTNFDN
jgi:hypothetical protein